MNVTTARHILRDFYDYDVKDMPERYAIERRIVGPRGEGVEYAIYDTQEKSKINNNVRCTCDDRAWAVRILKYLNETYS